MTRCYLQVRSTSLTQEHYETSTRDAGRRAQQLRHAGFRVIVSPASSQVTPVGRVNMTMLTVFTTDVLPTENWELVSLH